MSQSLFPGSLGTKRALDTHAYAPQTERPGKPRRQELEIKLAALQQDYAELHTAIFEAAQVHRRLCAPRLVRRGNFEIASEIFAVRHLPGDFFTVEETNDGVSSRSVTSAAKAWRRECGPRIWWDSWARTRL